MVLGLPPKYDRFLKGLVLAALMSLAGGYVLFLGVFPTVAFPPSGEASLPAVLIILLSAALVAGFACDELGMGIAVAILSVVGGIVIASAIALSPLAQGLYIIDPGEILGFIIHYGFVFLVLTFAVDFVGVVIGYGIHERFLVQRPRTFAEATAQHRK